MTFALVRFEMDESRKYAICHFSFFERYESLRLV